MSGKARTPHPKAIPNYERAVIPRGKLEGYALDPTHKVGADKARLFKGVLGFAKADWRKLEKAILDELPYHEAQPAGVGQWGEKYLVALPIVGLNGNTAVVETIWIIRPGTDYPNFVTPRTIRRKR